MRKVARFGLKGALAMDIRMSSWKGDPIVDIELFYRENYKEQ